MDKTLKLSQDILTEKQNKIIPENIKKGVTIFDILGNYDSFLTEQEYNEAVNTIDDILHNTSPIPTQKDIKLFSSYNEMINDESANPNDLAIIYSENISLLTENKSFDRCKFEDTIILNEPFTGETHGFFIEAEDATAYTECHYILTDSYFEFDSYSGYTNVYIKYESSDGITYNRVDGGNEIVDLYTKLQYYNYSSSSDPFNPIVGNFIKVIDNNYNGLYKYDLKENKNYISFPMISEISNLPEITSSGSSLNIKNKFSNKIDIDKVISLFNQIYEAQYSQYDISKGCYMYLDSLNRINLTCMVYRNNTNEYYTTMSFSNRFDNTTHKITSDLMLSSYGFTVNPSSLIKKFKTYILDLDNLSYTERLDTSYTVKQFQGSSETLYQIFTNNMDVKSCIYRLYISSDNSINIYNNGFNSYNESNNDIKSININILPNAYYWEYAYIIARNQINMTQDFAYEKTYYGKDGINTGTLQNTEGLSNEQLKRRIEIWNRFSDLTLSTTNLCALYDGAYNNSLSNSLKSVPNINTSNVTDTAYMFRLCSNLQSIPDFDLSNVTDMDSMFSSCHNLESIPNFNTGKVVNFNFTFANCRKITSIPNMNLSNAVHLYSTFHGCTNLINIPYMNAYNCIDVSLMVRNCPNLSNESLNNVLGIVASAKNVTWHSKVISAIGFSNDQMNICKTLSNYQVLRNKGWRDEY